MDKDSRRPEDPEKQITILVCVATAVLLSLFEAKTQIAYINMSFLSLSCSMNDVVNVYKYSKSDVQNEWDEVLYLQPIIPPKHFDIFPPDWGTIRRSRRVLIFL